MSSSRKLQWDGCKNVRDLGGLETNHGRKTCWGAIVRSDDPAKLTANGWEALLAHGIRTIVALRTNGIEENVLDTAPRPSELNTICVAIEDNLDPEFVDRWVNTNLWGTPLYYYDALMRWPARHVKAIATIAQAPSGGVFIHCGRGYDRAGIITMLLLAIAGVSPEDIIRDYELSVDPKRDELLAEINTTTNQVFTNILTKLDSDEYLLRGGLSPFDLNVLRTRLLEPKRENGQA